LFSTIGRDRSGSAAETCWRTLGATARGFRHLDALPLRVRFEMWKESVGCS
jgi:hypothetical protein